MKELLSIIVNKNLKFSAIAIIDINKKTAKFQGLLNGIPFVQSEYYDNIRRQILEAVEINQPYNKENLS